MDSGLNLFVRGKVPVLPKFSPKSAAAVRQIFKKADQQAD
jgi:hypothetical protein